MEMAQLKTEETLHNYLRRHFERISENTARQLAEQTVVLQEEVILDTRSSGSPQTEQNKSLPIIDFEEPK